MASAPPTPMRPADNDSFRRAAAMIGRDVIMPPTDRCQQICRARSTAPVKLAPEVFANSAGLSRTPGRGRATQAGSGDESPTVAGRADHIWRSPNLNPWRAREAVVGRRPHWCRRCRCHSRIEQPPVVILNAVIPELQKPPTKSSGAFVTTGWFGPKRSWTLRSTMLPVVCGLLLIGAAQFVNLLRKSLSAGFSAACEPDESKRAVQVPAGARRKKHHCCHPGGETLNMP